MKNYSIWSLFRNAFSGHCNWPQALPDVAPQDQYDAVIVGGGGHGLAAAYYLAKNHGVTNIAVLEKSWLGGGNVARNTTIVRSNYFHEARGRLTEQALKLWENLSRELNFNVMFSPRGIINLAHSTAQLDDYARLGNAMTVRGVNAELLTVGQIKQLVPCLDTRPEARFPITGGLMQRRAGTARHDAVAWGYGRAAALRGVDIVQNCEVTGIVRQGGKVIGIDTTRGRIRTPKVGICVAGASSRVSEMAEIRLPLENHLLQACVTEPVKPILNTIVTHGLFNFYISQTDKGELVMGGDIDGYNRYSTFGELPPLEAAIRACLSLFPSFSRLRLMRTWGGVVDMSMDGSPILSKTSLDGFYINAGWCYGGFKATPAVGQVLAQMMATDETPELAAPFVLDRFHSGHIIAEEGKGPKPWLYH
ncbi:sarcosine oxidase, beta subunit family [Nitrosococcus halophilus Nc 4]|uniref:Sarcosine oxidase subunit beta n=1 Tax=Nitrosococcus halophilus (strain Nc4) TaxID=472759 RepID=D5C1G3_NITHN|nr:sarcosine oxidase subunit beta family protein [Nitrosococcus halophilus]ADE16515.1 sarcosine oxidase, beta subunit family [Nitrosococcus halophilus Nc 4]